MLGNKACCHQYHDWVHLAKSTGDPKACSHLLAIHNDPPLKEPQGACKLFEVGFYQVTRVLLVHLVNIDSDLALVPSLGPLNKRHTAYRGQLLPAWLLQTFESFQERL